MAAINNMDFSKVPAVRKNEKTYDMFNDQYIKRQASLASAASDLRSSACLCARASAEA